MLKRIALLLLTGTFFFCAVLSASDISLRDNFSSGLSNWDKPSNRSVKLVDGKLGNRTAYGGYIALKEKNIGDFILTFRLKFLKGAEKQNGQFTIGIDRGYGKWNLYFTSNPSNSQITSKFTPKRNGIKNVKAPFNEVIKLNIPRDKWIDIKLTCNKSLYKLKMENESFILGTAPGAGGISIGSYRQPFVMDNFKLSYSTPERLSPNLLVNGSFEHASNSDIPDCWAGNGERYRTQGIPTNLCTDAGLKEFRKKFYLDNTNAFHGKKSICLEYPFHLLSKAVKVAKNKNYIISCYIKAKNNAQKVRLGVTRDSIKKTVKEKVIKVGKSWQRYEISLANYPQDLVTLMVKPLLPGKIWVDAVQLESGDKVSEFMPCWYDSGFSLPGDVNKNQCNNNTKAVIYNQKPKSIVANKTINISGLKLTSREALKNSYSLSVKIENKAEKAKKMHIAVCMTAKSMPEQIKTYSKKMSARKTFNLDLNGFVIKDLRVCINTTITDDNGKIFKQQREFIDVPRPLRIYPEWSFYTKEKEARIIVKFDCDMKKLENSKLKLETFVAGYMSYARTKNIFSIKSAANRQIFNIPVGRLKAGKFFIVRATLLDQNNKKIMVAKSELIKRHPTHTEVKINRINRGAYINGKPFLPYGILVSKFKEKQLEYYKKCGFSYIQFISHWNTTKINLKFLENCEKLDIKAIAFHVARPYSLSPSEAAKVYKSSPAMVGIVPNDESGDRVVYDRAIKTKVASPAILNCVNHHFHSYRMFANRIDGFPGDILSIDRYPFIKQPPGRPQTTNDIYSFELCLEMMDRDAKREIKPVYCWLQAAERFSKEPTPQQLSWQTYIALVNHCMGFTYFGGIPNSRVVWERMIQLNREVETLKPVLFSLEDEPKVSGANKTSVKSIRILPKKLGNELTIICVNDTLYPINATLDLSKAGISDSQVASVLFENRKLKTDKKGYLKDKFKPLERHVYKLRLKK